MLNLCGLVEFFCCLTDCAWWDGIVPVVAYVRTALRIHVVGVGWMEEDEEASLPLQPRGLRSHSHSAYRLPDVVIAGGLLLNRLPALTLGIRLRGQKHWAAGRAALLYDGQQIYGLSVVSSQWRRLCVVSSCTCQCFDLRQTICCIYIETAWRNGGHSL
jgi:hypothetical protein